MLTIKKGAILILGESITQIGITLYAEKMYSINFTETNKKFRLNLHCNGDKSYLFVNATEIIKFQAKDSEIVANENSDDLPIANVKKLD